jgi:predicted amidophosphoribosyltransferase
VLRAAAELVLPPLCAGCGAGGAPLCAGCAAPLTGGARPHAPVPRPAGLPPVWAAACYQGGARAALIAYKERNRRDLTPVLAAGLAAAVRAAAAGAATAVPGAATAAAAAAVQSGRAGSTGRPRLVLVPVPSRRRAARRRGGDHVLRLARAAGTVLGGTALICPALRPAGVLADAAGLSAAQRRASRVGAFAVHAAYTKWVADRAGMLTVVVVDDLVTTGATLAEAARALAAAGVRCHAGAVVAATLRNHPGGPVSVDGQDLWGLF